MAERKNTGLAVSDAKRLNDCFNQLSEAIAARPSMNGDRELWQFDYAALPGGPEGDERVAWNHRCGSRDIAFVALRGAVVNDNLQLWTNGPHGEAKIDRFELKGLTLNTFASGTYQPDNRLLDTAGLADSPLWVKETDWRQYMSELWVVRYGIDWVNSAPPADKPLLPPEGQFVTLSHALSWVAFGVSMDSDQLHEVLTLDRYGEHHPQEAIKAALAELVELGRAGRVAMEGKYRESHRVDKRTLLTIAIEPTKFANFRQFNYLNDELKHGDGLWQWRQSKTVELRGNRRGGRLDSFIEVGVNRTDLLREFHSESSENSLPIQKASETPTELPVWLNPYQVKAWVLYRDLALVASAGDWNGLAAQRLYGDEEPIIGSIKELIDCLQVGRMIAQGQKNGETFQPIAPVEWTRIALAPLDLSRQHPYVRIQFNRRDVLASFPAIGGGAVAADQSSAETESAALRAPAVKAGRPPSNDEILAKADEMKARGMDGRTIAKEMRLEPGFCNVATTAVRELIKGRWKPGRPPKKSA